MKDFCIVVPIYKEDLDCIEKVSLQRLADVTQGKYDIYFLCPFWGDALKNYKDIYKYQFYTINFDEKYFASEFTYSQICLSYDFYKAFANKYKYMLIYQLDCYLFRDDIQKWVDKDYDYIGAPLVSTNCGWRTERILPNGRKVYKPMVGNGGFSLRKISTFMEITDPNGEFRKYTGLSDEKFAQVQYEDLFFCDALEGLYDLTKPDWKEAMEFALDMNVENIYNDMKLNPSPMGVHAIGKNIRYWKNVIPELNTDEIINYCEDKYKEFFKLYYK